MIAAGTGLAVGGAADNAALEAVARSHRAERNGSRRPRAGLRHRRRAHARPRGAPRRPTRDRRARRARLQRNRHPHRATRGRGRAGGRGARGARERLVATPFSFERQGERRDLGTELAQRIGSTVAEGGCALVLPDAMGCNPPALLGQLHDALGFVPVLGAVAAGAPMFELYNTDAMEGALVGVALSGLAPVIGVTQGCTPIGEPYVITHAEANVIQRIGSRPALEMLTEAIRANPDTRGAHPPGRRVRRARDGSGQVAARARRLPRAQSRRRGSIERRARRRRARADRTDVAVPDPRRRGLASGSSRDARRAGRAPPRSAAGLRLLLRLRRAAGADSSASPITT